jgi:hypothetical protein
MYLQVSGQPDPLLFIPAFLGYQEKGNGNKRQQEDQESDHRVEAAGLLLCCGLEISRCHFLLPLLAPEEESFLPRVAFPKPRFSSPRH